MTPVIQQLDARNHSRASNQTIAVVPAAPALVWGPFRERQYGPSLESSSPFAVSFGYCVLNVANLMLARAVARRSQTAVRLAIGATPGKLSRGPC
jgi:hypothetical protein